VTAAAFGRGALVALIVLVGTIGGMTLSTYDAR
jgi:hypothetical protein